MTETLGDIIGDAFKKAKRRKTSEEDYRPDTPFHVWLQAVVDIEVHMASLHKQPVHQMNVGFWWNLYRNNFSPVLAHNYNLEGMDIPTPEDKDGLFEQNPFPRDPAPDIIEWMGL